MADPGKHSEFSPEELDRLEDALERWTGAGDDDAAPVPEDSLLTPPLRERLADYRSLLTTIRAELPMEEVPDGLLADVLAEAHHTAESVPTSDKPGRREAAGPSLWERLRRSLLLPGFALAGTAAVMLWMVQPSDDAPTTLAYSDTPKSEAARLAPEAAPAPAAAQEPELDADAAKDAPGSLDGSAAGGVMEEKKAEMQAPAAVAPAPADAVSGAAADPIADPRADRKATGKAKKAVPPSLESYPGLDDAATVEGDKEALRDTLEQAHAARRKGRCGEAMSLYVEAMKMTGADSERAQAEAGYGLCLIGKGDDHRADKYFDAARKLSPAIDGWIKRERGDSPAKKAPAKPSAKSKLEEPFMTRIDEPVK